MPHLPVRHRVYGAPATIKRRGNPYFADRRADRIGCSLAKDMLSKLSPRFWLLLFLAIIVIILFIYLAGWSTLLSVKKFEVRGTNLIPGSSVEDIARQRLSLKRIFVLPENGLIFYNSNALVSELKERYPLEQVKVVKRLPSTVVVTITERTPAAIWFEADSYYEVDKEGWVLSLTEGPVEGLPTLYNNGYPALDGKQVKNKERFFTFSADLGTAFSQRFPYIAIKQLVVDNELSTIKLIPLKGAFIYFSTDDSVTTQLERLDLLLQSELKGRFEKIRYIDLRFGDKVYYQ